MLVQPFRISDTSTDIGSSMPSHWATVFQPSRSSPRFSFTSALPPKSSVPTNSPSFCRASLNSSHSFAATASQSTFARALLTLLAKLTASKPWRKAMPKSSTPCRVSFSQVPSPSQSTFLNRLFTAVTSASPAPFQSKPAAAVPRTANRSFTRPPRVWPALAQSVRAMKAFRPSVSFSASPAQSMASSFSPSFAVKPLTPSASFSANWTQSNSSTNPAMVSASDVNNSAMVAPTVVKSISARALFRNSATLAPMLVKLTVSSVQ